MLLFLLFTKHFICDFLLQGPYQYKNKGTYGHPGGLLHAGITGLGTFVAFCFVADAQTATLFAMVDFFLHYHIDWAKMNLNNKMNWKPDNSEKFWWLLGFDQYLHTLTYLAMTYAFYWPLLRS